MYEHMVSVIGRVKTIQYIMTSLGQLRSVSAQLRKGSWSPDPALLVWWRGQRCTGERSEKSAA